MPPRVPLVVNLLLWAVSLSIMFIIIFGVSGGKLSLVTTSLYVSFGHLGKYLRSRRFEHQIHFLCHENLGVKKMV